MRSRSRPLFSTSIAMLKNKFNFLFSLSGLLTLLACLPVVALIWTALQGDSEIWGHLLRYVIPHTLAETGILCWVWEFSPS